jgi:uncharacterized membrane protein
MAMRNVPEASTTTTTPVPRARAGIALPGVLLGIGLGGFVDGIVLHQLLQWHHLLSSTKRHPPTTVGGLEANTVADGLFHAATWAFAAVGLLLAWRAARRGAIEWDSRGLIGWMLAGWGLFNLVEGTVNHHVLRLHHVREGVAGQGAYDVAFLLLGVLLVAIGVPLGRAGRSRPPLAARAVPVPTTGGGRRASRDP